MNWKWNFDHQVLVLPASVLSADASPEQLRILLWLASDPMLAEKPAQLAKLAGCSQKEIGNAMDFWQQNGVITCAGAPAPTSKPAAPAAKQPSEAKAGKTASMSEKKLLNRADELPTYSSTELAEMMEQRASLRVLVDESQNIFGKIFNMHELNILFGMVDYLNLDEEYILLLLAHCRRIEIKTLRSVERYAIALIDSGVENAQALEDRMQTLEARHALEGKLRGMFGLKSRSLTAKEKTMLEKWISYGYDEEILRMAYEITVDATKEPSIPYANAILERWHTEGLQTAAEIRHRLEQEKSDKQEKNGKGLPTVGSSFNPDDFLEAAIERSFRKNQTEG